MCHNVATRVEGQTGDLDLSSLKMMQIFIHKVIQTCIHQTVYEDFTFALNVVKCFHCSKNTQKQDIVELTRPLNSLILAHSLFLI